MEYKEHRAVSKELQEELVKTYTQKLQSQGEE